MCQREPCRFCTTKGFSSVDHDLYHCPRKPEGFMFYHLRAGSLVPKSSTESRAASASEIVLIRAAGRAGSKAATPGTQ